MPKRERSLVVVYVSHERPRIIAEDSVRAEVVRGRVETDNKVPRKQILTDHLVVCVRIDENVGERCGCISDVTAPREHRQKLAYLPVYSCYLTFAVFDVDRGIVCFIVNQQHGRIYALATT